MCCWYWCGTDRAGCFCPRSSFFLFTATVLTFRDVSIERTFCTRPPLGVRVTYAMNRVFVHQYLPVIRISFINLIGQF